MQDLLLAEMRRLEDPWRLWNQPDDGLTPPPTPLPRQPKAKKSQKMNWRPRAIPHPAAARQRHGKDLWGRSHFHSRRKTNDISAEVPPVCGRCHRQPRLRLFAADASADQGRQPNVLFILTDDQRWDAIGLGGSST